MMTVSEYARAKGISRQAVSAGVKAGRIRSNGKTGRELRIIGEDDSPATVREDGGEMYKARLEKIRLDSKVQAQRLSENREADRREYMALIVSEFVKAFEPVKVRLADLQLSEEQTAALASIIDSSLRAFEAGVQAHE